MMSPSPIVRGKRSFLPGGIPRLDKNHFLLADWASVRSVCVAVNPGQTIDLVIQRERPLSVGGTYQYASHRGAIMAGSGWTNSESTDMDWSSGAWTVMAFFQEVGSSVPTNYPQIVGRSFYTNESSNSGWTLQHRPTADGLTGYNFYIGANNATTNACFTEANNPDWVGDNGDHTAIAYSDGSSTKGIRLDKGTHYTSGSGNLVPATSTGSYGVGTTNAAGSLRPYIVLCFSRVIDMFEYEEWISDPFSMLIYPEDEIFELTKGLSIIPQFYHQRHHNRAL